MWKDYLKKGTNDFMEDIDSIMDKIFSYEKKFYKMGTTEYLSYYYVKHRRTAARLLLYNAPVAPLIVFAAIQSIAKFIVFLSTDFMSVFFSFIFLCVGLFLVLGRQLRGCIILLIGLVLFDSHVLPGSDMYLTSLLGLVFSFVNLCKLRTMQRYADLALDIEKSKIKLKAQEMDEEHMETIYKLKDKMLEFKGRDI
jgi:hypothetical protein